jgi:hypothetical protein
LRAGPVGSDFGPLLMTTGTGSISYTKTVKRHLIATARPI